MSTCLNTISQTFFEVYRGHYMASQRNEISLWLFSRVRAVQPLKWSRPRNDPQPWNDPQIDPEIWYRPRNDPHFSSRRNDPQLILGMELVFNHGIITNLLQRLRSSITFNISLQIKNVTVFPSFLPMRPYTHLNLIANLLSSQKTLK